MWLARVRFAVEEVPRPRQFGTQERTSRAASRDAGVVPTADSALSDSPGLNCEAD